MKKIRNRIIALMLSVIMIFGFIPCNIVSAVTITESGSDWAILAKYLAANLDELDNGVVENSNGDELFDFIDAYGRRSIKLLSDIKGSTSDVALNVDASFVIDFDLNGHILDRGLIAPNGTITNDANGSVINLMSGSLCIYDFSNPKTPHYGKIDSSGLWIPTSGQGDDTVEIKGGIITGGTGTYIGEPKNTYEGGAIYISGNNAKLDINGGNICGNTCDKGGAISVSGLSVEVKLNGGNISYNTAESDGGGIYNEKGSISINKGTISNNTAGSGGGIYNINLGLLSINEQGVISNNRAWNNGGGICNESENIIVINGGTISNNTAGEEGGGIYDTVGGITLNEGSSICENEAIDGGGIYKQSMGDITINGGSVSNNTAIGAGGGIYSVTGTINLGSGTIEDNVAPNGSAIQKEGGTIKTYQRGIKVTGDIRDISVIPSKELYLVNVDSNYKGKITSSPAVGESGTEVTITATVPYTYFMVDDEKINGNKFTLGDKSVTISLVAPTSSGSKKYKTNILNNQDIKVLGSEKKGSKRTIVITNNKKVQSILVKDKNDNEIEVTKNEDGTYTFIQPASDVTIDVTFKNRVITLNIGSTKASVDGEESNLDVCPILRNDRTMLPIRFIAENLGATVTWDEKNPNYVLITRGDTKIEITLESDIMLVNNKEVKLDQVAFAENDRTYLPVRAISEALNAVVEWDESKPSIVKIYER